MPDPVKAVAQQVAAVGDHQHGAPVGVDQVPQAVQVLEVQEHIRLVHDEQAGKAEHLADDLHQLQLAAAEGLQGQLLLVRQLCKLQLTADVDLVIVRIHGIAFVQKGLVTLHDGVHILGGLHLHAHLTDGLLQSVEIPAEVVEDGDGLVAVPEGELAHIAHAARALPAEFAVIEEAFRLPDQAHQGGLAGAVAADEGAVAVLFQGEGDVLEEGGAGETKSQFFGVYHK